MQFHRCFRFGRREKYKTISAVSVSAGIARAVGSETSSFGVTISLLFNATFRLGHRKKTFLRLHRRGGKKIQRCALSPYKTALCYDADCAFAREKFVKRCSARFAELQIKPRWPAANRYNMLIPTLITHKRHSEFNAFACSFSPSLCPTRNMSTKRISSHSTRGTFVVQIVSLAHTRLRPEHLWFFARRRMEAIIVGKPQCSY